MLLWDWSPKQVTSQRTLKSAFKKQPTQTQTTEARQLLAFQELQLQKVSVSNSKSYSESLKYLNQFWTQVSVAHWFQSCYIGKKNQHLQWHKRLCKKKWTFRVQSSLSQDLRFSRSDSGSKKTPTLTPKLSLQADMKDIDRLTLSIKTECCFLPVCPCNFCTISFVWRFQM